MKTLLRWLLAAGIVIVLAIATVAVALAYLPYPDATVRIDGETLSLSGLDGWAAAALLAAASMALVSFVLASALGIVAGIVVALLVALLAVAAVGAVLLLLASPFLLLGWLVWRAASGARAPTPAAVAS
jgi:hypothetical protein